MEYKELIERLKSMLPEKVLYGDLIGAEGVYAHSGPMVYEDPEPYFIEQAITAITDLLARAEAAEARAEKAERERDAAIKWIHEFLESMDMSCKGCKHYTVKESDLKVCAECSKERDKWEWNGGKEE